MAAAEQVVGSLHARLAPDEVALEFGVKVSGELSWWFFAKSQAEGTIKVSLQCAQAEHAVELLARLATRTSRAVDWR